MKKSFSKPETRKSKPIFAKKSFGQNFLVDENYIGKIISALAPRSDETIVEIGAGRGALTEKLIESGAKVFAVEIERDMIAILRKRFDENEKFILVEQDALKVNFSELLKAGKQKTKAKLVANLPYYISTAILQNLIEQRGFFSELVLMFQREVADRITAKTESKERGFLTVLTETYFDIEMLFNISPQAFRPVPKVWSSLVRLVPKSCSAIRDEELYKSLISSAFKQRRKTLWNNLKDLEINKSGKQKNWDEISLTTNISLQRRAESLSAAEWKKLFDSIYFD